MHPLNNNSHFIDRLARERYNDRRREADAWRLAKAVRAAAEAACDSAESRLERAISALRRQFTNAPQQVTGC